MAKTIKILPNKVRIKWNVRTKKYLLYYGNYLLMLYKTPSTKVPCPWFDTVEKAEEFGVQHIVFKDEHWNIYYFKPIVMEIIGNIYENPELQ